MRTHNRVWLVVVAGGWALVLLTAAATGGFKHPPTWANYYQWELVR